MASFASVAAFQSVLQRKALVGALLIAPHSTAAIVDICSSGGGLGTLTGHKSIGKLTSDGVTFGDAVTKQETRGFGDNYPSRIDVSQEDATLTFAALETNKAVIDAFSGVDQTAIVKDPSTGTIKFDKPPLPVIRDVRALALFKDNNADGTGDIYLSVYFLRCNITQNGDQTYAFTDAGLTYPMQAAALMDDAAGTAIRLMWGGPGLASLTTAMGY